MYKEVILHSLSKSNVNVFDEVITAIEYEFHKPVTNIQEMKFRQDKKRKGDIWEAFCKDWLLATGMYINVWLLQEYNQTFNINHSKQDNGIDIIAQTYIGEWYAIQCKYRSKGKVTWKSLSTFIALCERTGPVINGQVSIPGSWGKYIVMTNTTGVTHKLPKTAKDKSICRKTFQNTSRDHWLRMIDKDQGYKLMPPDLINNLQELKIATPSVPIKSLQLVVLRSEKSVSQPKDLDDLRKRRLAYFEKN